MRLLEGRRESFVTDGGEEAREGILGEGLDPGEPPLGAGDLRCPEGAWVVIQAGLRRELELDLGLRAGRTGEGRKPEVWERQRLKLWRWMG